MTRGPDAEDASSPSDAVPDASDAADRRDEVVARVTDHAGRIARELARLQGGDYGRETLETDAGSWTLSYEAGDVQYLRFEGGGAETYVVSEHQPPAPGELAAAMADYDAFVAAFEAFVRSRERVLADVSVEYPPVASVDAVVEKREGVLSDLRETADAMARRLRRFEGGDYGTFTARVDGTRWELKWEDGRANYLRVGGEGGVYLLSQYQPPSAEDLRAHVPAFGDFVEAFNDEVTAASDALDPVSP